MSTARPELWLDETGLAGWPEERRDRSRERPRRRRRALRNADLRPRWRRRRLALVLAVVGLVAAAAIPLSLGGSGRRATVRPAVAPARVEGVGTLLRRIAQCESSGDPAAVSPTGLYRGEYQFDFSTWRSVGGRGDPAGAPLAAQRRRATRLLDDRGIDPWPVCGPIALVSVAPPLTSRSSLR